MLLTLQSLFLRPCLFEIVAGHQHEKNWDRALVRLHSKSMVMLTTLLLLLTLQEAWAEESQELRALRPQCQHVSNGICLAPDVSQRVRLYQTPLVQDALNLTVKRAEEFLSTVDVRPNRMVLVDLDETLLDNIPFYKRVTAFNPKAFQKWVAAQKPQPFNPKVKSLLHHAQARGFKIAFITGRSADMAEPTLRDTRPFKWDAAFFRPLGATFKSKDYKASVRKMLTDLGFEIVLNIGDQLSDFNSTGKEPQESCGQFLLPNPIYAIP
jgi:5'-nucleotidase (lipoprotein e(P4) family)